MARTFRLYRRSSAPARRSRALITILAALIALLFVSIPKARMDAPDAYAIKDAQIVVSPGKTIAKGTVVFRKGLIVDVGENAKIPADARVIDGSGSVVYPGLIDAYTNLGLPAPAVQQTTPAGGGRQAALAAAAGGQQPPPEVALGDPSVSAADQVKPGGSAIEDARTVGVTSALSSPRQGIFAGQSALINLGSEDPSHLVLRAPVALTVQFTTGSGFSGNYPASLMGTVAYIRQTFLDAIHYRDLVDRYNRGKRGVERPPYDKRLAALLPALNGELPVLFVASSDLDVGRVLTICGDFPKVKPIVMGALYGYRVADALKSKNVPVIVSVDFPRRPSDLPEDEDEPLRVLRNRAEALKNAARLVQAGVKIAFTSGTLRPTDFIANVQKAIENGLPKDEALRALTTNAAEILGASEQVGSIEVGKVANLVVAGGDLLARDAKIKHVFIDGNEVELKKPEPQPARGGGRPGGRPAAVDPSGEWNLIIRAPDGDQNAKLTINRQGDQITGVLATHIGNLEVKDARLNGNELRFAISGTLNGQSLEATVTSTIEGDSIRGAIVIASMGSFEFTGTRPR
ncbi:MAG TPA: amidohydrolase family protein [Blastocatellia bacterium]|nr:amidohydrolase family protein [Blastocatellia bacterium]